MPNNVVLPWIHIYNYIQDYFLNAYKRYMQIPGSYPVTYYSLDKASSIWEDEMILGGSYSHRGVGDLSGVKWKKISMLPVFFIDQMIPQNDSTNRGFTLEGTLRTQVAFPSIYGLEPSPDDRIDLSFAFSNNDQPFKHIYTVNNYNLAHIGEYFNIYQLQLAIDNSNGDIEKQISSYWTFYDFEKKIIPMDNAKVLMSIQERAGNIIRDVNDNNFDRQSGLFLEQAN